MPDAPAIYSRQRRPHLRAAQRPRQPARARAARARPRRGRQRRAAVRQPSRVRRVFWAARRAGLRLTPINWHLTGEEAAYIVDDCDAKAFIADARFAAMRAAHVAQQAPTRRVRLAVGGAIARLRGLRGRAAGQDGSDIEDPQLGTPMLYTSGTTGRPKGVHRATPPADADASCRARPNYGRGESVHLCTGPLYHAAPLAFSLACRTARARRSC